MGQEKTNYWNGLCVETLEEKPQTIFDVYNIPTK